MTVALLYVLCGSVSSRHAIRIDRSSEDVWNLSMPVVGKSVFGDSRFPYISDCHNTSLVDFYQHHDNLLYHSCIVHSGECIVSPRSVGATQRLPPLILWSTSPDATPQPGKAQQANAKYLPEGSEMRWVDDEGLFRMVQAISAELSQAGIVHNVCESVVMLRPKAYQADIWRALVLWKYGGLYMDAHFFLQKNAIDMFPALRESSIDCETNRHVGRTFEEEDFGDSGDCQNGVVHLVQDAIDKNDARSTYQIYNAIMFASRPRLDFFECYFSLVTSNVAKRYYGWERGWLCQTGPYAVSVALQQYRLGMCGDNSNPDFGALQRGIQVRFQMRVRSDGSRSVVDRYSGDVGFINTKELYRDVHSCSIHYATYYRIHQVYKVNFLDKILRHTLHSY